MRMPPMRSALPLVCAGLLAACGGTVQQKLGLARKVPDEFQVVRRAPLVVPPELRLPEPNPAARGPHGDVSEQAKEVLVGRPAAAKKGLSPGERALIAAVPVEPEPDIRRKLLEENTELVDLSEKNFLYVFEFQRKQLRPEGETIDPVAEAARLAAEGRARKVITTRTGSEPLVRGQGGS